MFTGYTQENRKKRDNTEVDTAVAETQKSPKRIRLQENKKDNSLYKKDIKVVKNEAKVSNIKSKEDCCIACEKDSNCGASVYVASDLQCWLKQPGGTPINKKGVVACYPS